MLRVWLTPLILISAALHINAEYNGPRSRVYLLKPLTTTLILLIALSAPDPISLIYKWSIIVGLAFSLAGDIFLMLPQDRFIPGLISFLIAHLTYILAFTGDTRGVMNPWLAIPFLIYALAFYTFLAPALNKYRIPVLIYTVVISVMAWAAWGRWVRLDEPAALAAAIGALFFVASDSLLAYNRFRHQIGWGQLAILSTYYLAQLLLAWSV